MDNAQPANFAMAKSATQRNKFSGPLRHKPNAYLEQWLAAIVESSDDAIMSKDLNGVITTWNRGAETLFGYAAKEVVGKSVTLLTPPGGDKEGEILERIKRGESVAAYETVRQHKNGTLIDISLKLSPIRLASGEVVGASTIIRDIGERKRAQEGQALLLREMSHRVTNVLAVANGLVALTARTQSDPQTMAKTVQERLSAFTRAHELTRPGLMGSPDSEGRRSTLRTLIHTIVAPYADFERVGERSCVVVDGKDIAIGGGSVTGLALILHEFTTNSAKYGALSSPNGCIRLAWKRGDGNLVLSWTELGGPRIENPPKKQGFGSVLAHRTVCGQFGGELSYDWLAEGLVIRMSLPLARLG